MIIYDSDSSDYDSYVHERITLTLKLEEVVFLKILQTWMHAQIQYMLSK